jgi:hypothetical protein
VSTVAEIAAFIRATQGGLSTETLAKAIRRRWPDATEDEVREAFSALMESSAQSSPELSK